MLSSVPGEAWWGGREHKVVRVDEWVGSLREVQKEEGACGDGGQRTGRGGAIPKTPHNAEGRRTPVFGSGSGSGLGSGMGSSMGLVTSSGSGSGFGSELSGICAHRFEGGRVQSPRSRGRVCMGAGGRLGLVDAARLGE